MSLKKVSKKMNPKDIIKKSYTDSIHEDLEAKGVRFFKPEDSLNIDSEYLVLPKDITEVSPRNLGKYLNAYTQQKMYIRTLLGWCECMYEDTRRTYMETAYPKYHLVNSSKMTEKAKDLEVNNSEDVLPLYSQMMDMKMKKSTLELNLASIEDAIFLISREISRRNGDFSDENRNYNIGSY